MALNWPTFFKRLGSAVVFAAIMMTGLLWKDWTFTILMAVIMTLCIREFFRLGSEISGTDGGLLIERSTQVTAIIFFAMILGSQLGLLDVPLVKLLPALLLVPVTLFMMALLSPKSQWHQGLMAFGSILYIVLPCFLLILFRQVDWILPLALILMIWMNDTMAYLVGSFIGKTPFSKISPKKTWEGTVGGALFTVALAAIWGYYSHKFAIIDWMMLAICASVAGTAGDLLESKLKRMAGVKDSGTMMPGHGGALDRFDSLLVATPFAFCYAYLFMQP